MKYLISVALCAGLVGCWSTTPHTPTLTSSAKESVVDSYADKADLIMSRAAAAVVVAKQANSEENKESVDKELGIALAYLPRPTEEDLNYAIRRANTAGTLEYQKQREVADRHQRQVDSLWGLVEAEKQKAADELQAKDMVLKASQKREQALFWCCIGGLFMLFGMSLFIWGDKLGASKVESAVVIGCGFLAASMPWIAESDYSTYILAGLSTVIAIRIAVSVWSFGWSKVSNKETDEKEKG
jgi:hypothetical protein